MCSYNVFHRDKSLPAVRCQVPGAAEFPHVAVGRQGEPAARLRAHLPVRRLREDAQTRAGEQGAGRRAGEWRRLATDRRGRWSGVGRRGHFAIRACETRILIPAVVSSSDEARSENTKI